MHRENPTPHEDHDDVVEPATMQLHDAATLAKVRRELDDVLQAGVDTPRLAGIPLIRTYLNSGRVEQALEALARLDAQAQVQR